MPPRGHGLKGVGRQVAEDLQAGPAGPSRPAADRDRGRPRREPLFDSARPAASRAASASDGVQVAGSQVLGVGPRELEEPRDDLLEPIDLVDQAAERFVVEPDDPRCQSWAVDRMPASGLRTSWATPASSLPSAASRSLRRRSVWSRSRSAACRRTVRARPGGQRERQRDPPQGQARGQPVALERRSTKSGSTSRVITQVAPTTRPSTTTGAVRMATVTGRSPVELLDGEQHLLLADRRVDLDVDQVGLERRQARLASSVRRSARLAFVRVLGVLASGLRFGRRCRGSS